MDDAGVAGLLAAGAAGVGVAGVSPGDAAGGGVPPSDFLSFFISSISERRMRAERPKLRVISGSFFHPKRTAITIAMMTMCHGSSALT